MFAWCNFRTGCIIANILCRSDSMTVDRNKAYFPRTDSDSQASRLVHVDVAIAQLPRAPSSFSHSMGTYPVNSMLPVTQSSYQMGLEQGLYSHVPSLAGGRNSFPGQPHPIP